MLCKILFYTICLLASMLSAVTYGQNACPDPPDYGYWHFELDTAGNDITSKDYWIHYTGTGSNPPAGVKLLSPFHQPSHDPIIPLQGAPTSNKDNKVEDGWELLFHDFGWRKQDTVGEGVNPSFEHSVEHVLLILYNKYNATLRVLFNLNEPNQGEDRMAIRLQFKRLEDEWKESALLSHATYRMYAVEDFPKKAVLTSLSEVTNKSKAWYFADFPMAYDPCTCTEDTRLNFRVQLVDVVDIDLKADGVITSIGLASNCMLVNSQ